MRTVGKWIVNQKSPRSLNGPEQSVRTIRIQIVIGRDMPTVCPRVDRWLVYSEVSRMHLPFASWLVLKDAGLWHAIRTKHLALSARRPRSLPALGITPTYLPQHAFRQAFRMAQHSMRHAAQADRGLVAEKPSSIIAMHHLHKDGRGACVGAPKNVSSSSSS